MLADMEAKFRALIIGQGLAGTCLAIEFERRGLDYLVVDASLGETASRVAAGLVNPAMGKHFRPGWRNEECCAYLKDFYPELEKKFEKWLGGKRFWQQLPIWREIADSDQLETWKIRQQEPETSSWAGPLLPWPADWNGEGTAAYTRGSSVLDAASMTNAAREWLISLGKFREEKVEFSEIKTISEYEINWKGEIFSHVIWCNGWEFGQIPEFSRFKGRPAQGCIIDVELPDFHWNAGILHFGHWLVPSLHEEKTWRFGATYAWQWENPGIPSPLAESELLNDLQKRYLGTIRVVRARAAVRPIIRQSQPIAGKVPGFPGHWVLGGLGSKGVTTAPWTAMTLAKSICDGEVIPSDLDPELIRK